MPSIPHGLICEFVEHGWPIKADSSPPLTSNHSINYMLTCGNSYFHSAEMKDPYIAFFFSKPIFIDSYAITSSQYGFNTLSNWELFQSNSQNQWISIDNQTNYDIRGNTEKIHINTPGQTTSIKLIGGLDVEGNNYFIKLSKIEFYGKVLLSTKEYISKRLPFLISIILTCFIIDSKT